jgi:hypothetical protein
MGAMSAWAGNYNATLTHTASSFCSTDANSYTSTVDAAKEHVNNAAFNATWQGAAYAEFAISIPSGESITSATLTFLSYGEKRNERNSKNGETSNTRSKSQNNAYYKKKKQKNNFTNPTIPNERSNYDMNINKKVFGKIIERKKSDSFDDNNEVYILDPTKALLKLNNELLFYKESHQNFWQKLKKSKKLLQNMKK